MKAQAKIIKISALAVAISSCGVINLANADEAIERDPILSIGDVIVVHGERATATELSTTHWSIDEDEIRALGAQTLDQLLKNVPGLYVRTGGQGTPRVDIRGFKTRHVTFLINGVPANGAEDGQFDPSVIPSSQIASVEVSVGPTSVLYGPGGAGGVINIITKQGDNSPLLSGKLEVAADNTYNGDISAASSGDNWQSLISVSHQQTDGFPLSGDYPDNENQQGDIRNNSDKSVDNIYAQGSYWLSEETQITANMSVRSGEWGKPSRDGTSSGSIKFERVDDYQSQTFQLGMAHRFSDMFIFRGFGYHNQSDVVENQYTNEQYNTLKQSQDGRSTVQGANLQLISDFSESGSLTTAFIAENQSWTSASESYSKKKSIHPAPLAAPAYVTGKGGGSGGGSGGGNEAFDDSAWLYTLAGEYQYQSDGDYGVTLGAAYHDQERKSVAESDYSGQVSGYWQLFDHTKLNAGIAKKVRFPSMRNLYAQSSGNADLVAEKSQHFELGLVQGIGGDTELNIAGYYTDAENYIAKDTSGVYQNMGRYQFKGVDLSLNNQSIDALSVTLAYSFLDTEDKDAKDGMDTLEYRPRHQFRLQADYQLPFSMRINMNLERIMGQVYYAQKKANGNKLWLEQSLEDYTLLDLNLTQVVMDDKLELYLRATNLLDENYYQSEAIPQAGRQLFVGINWQI
ncbi:MAG: TonB-dependent receptor [Shewanella sp.]|nr:TonB-dependent receptor [Shewanella sp.]